MSTPTLTLGTRNTISITTTPPGPSRNAITDHADATFVITGSTESESDRDMSESDSSSDSEGDGEAFVTRSLSKADDLVNQMCVAISNHLDSIDLHETSAQLSRMIRLLEQTRREVQNEILKEREDD